MFAITFSNILYNFNIHFIVDEGCLEPGGIFRNNLVTTFASIGPQPKHISLSAWDLERKHCLRALWYTR